MAAIANMEKYARKFQKHDLDRLGIFVEMPYMCTGQKRPKKRPKPQKKEPEIKGAMLAGCTKSKCGNQDGYFNEEFKRVFVGERPRKRLKPKRIKPQIPFLPASPSKKHSTPNDYFGCFYEEPPTRFSPAVKGEKSGPKKIKTLILRRPNITSSPGKKGGCGYVNITLGEYPEHSSGFFGPKAKTKASITKSMKNRPKPFISVTSPKKYFDPNPYCDVRQDPPKGPTYKRPVEKEGKKTLDRRKFMPPGRGGGTFSPWPKHSEEKYLTPTQIEKYVKPDKKGNQIPVKKYVPFIPPNLVTKLLQTASTLSNVKFAVTTSNYKTYEPTYVKYL